MKITNLINFIVSLITIPMWVVVISICVAGDASGSDGLLMLGGLGVLVLPVIHLAGGILGLVGTIKNVGWTAISSMVIHSVMLLGIGGLMILGMLFD